MAGGVPRGVSELECHRGLRTQSAVVEGSGKKIPKMLCKTTRRFVPMWSDQFETPLCNGVLVVRIQENN
jgi:hypothetical protein